MVTDRARCSPQELLTADAVVLGAGAIGMCLAAAVAESGRIPILVSEWREHRDAMQDCGLEVIDEAGLKRIYPVRSMSLDEFAGLSDVKLTYLAVKSQGTECYASALAKTLAPDGLVVSLQNGLNEYRLAEIVGSNRVIGAVSPISAQRVGPGKVRIFGSNRTFVLGELDAAITPRLEALARIGSAEPWRTELSENILGVLWSKLLNNTRLNTLCVLSGGTVDETVRDPFFGGLMLRIVFEFAEVVDALGVTPEPLPSIDVPALLDAIRSSPNEARRHLEWHAEGFRGAKPSTLQDIDAGRPTEIEYLSGEVVRQARRCGIGVPVIEAVTSGVIHIERNGVARRGQVVSTLKESLAAILAQPLPGSHAK